MLSSLHYQNIILISAIAIFMGIILILTKTREKLTKLKAIISLGLWIASAIIFVYIVFNSWTIPTGIALVIVMAVMCLIQNIIDNKETKETEAIKEEN